MSRCQVVLALNGIEWLNIRDTRGGRRLDQPEDFVRLEIETAFESKIPVIPVFVEDASPPDRGQLPQSLASLSRLQGEKLRGGSDFPNDVELLIRRIRELFEEHHGAVFASDTAQARYSSRLKAGLTAAAVTIFMAPLVLLFLSAATADFRRLNDLALSPDGNYIAAVYGQGPGTPGMLRSWNARTGESVVRLSPPGAPFWITRWSPDGTWLAVGTHRGEVHVWRWPTMEERKTFSGPQGILEALAWSPNGKQLAVGDDLGRIWVWEVATTKRLSSKTIFRQKVSALTWSPAAARLAGGSWDESVALFDIGEKTSPVTLNLRASYVDDLAWSADGKLLAVSDDAEVRVWDVNTDQVIDTHETQEAQVVGWIPDGRQFVTRNHTIQVWALGTSRPRAEMETTTWEGLWFQVF